MSCRGGGWSWEWPRLWSISVSSLQQVFYMRLCCCGKPLGHLCYISSSGHGLETARQWCIYARGTRLCVTGNFFNDLRWGSWQNMRSVRPGNFPANQPALRHTLHFVFSTLAEVHLSYKLYCLFIFDIARVCLYPDVTKTGGEKFLCFLHSVNI